VVGGLGRVDEPFWKKKANSVDGAPDSGVKRVGGFSGRCRHLARRCERGVFVGGGFIVRKSRGR